MNPIVEDCLHMMSNLALEETQKSDRLDPTESQDCSDTMSNTSTVPLEYYVSSDSEGVQSAPELSAAQRKSDNARMYPLEVKLYWTYEELERGAMKKRKGRLDVYNGVTVKRRKCLKELGEVAKNHHHKSQLKREMGYEADDEN